MKKCVTVIAAGGLLFSMAAAQDIPTSEVFLGYNYVRFNSANNVSTFRSSGGSGEYSHNFNRGFSLVADIGAVHNGNHSGFQIDNTAVNFLAGPRFSFRKWSRVTPYVQTLFGGVYYTASTHLEGAAQPQPLIAPGIEGRPITARLITSQTDFAMTAGGGLDITINRHMRFRPIGLDYYMTRLKSLRTLGDNNQDNLRYSTGLTFTFGGEQPTPPGPVAKVTKTCWNGTTVAMGAPCPKQDLALSLSASTTEMCQGEVARVNPSVTGEGPNQQMNYQWTVNGQPVGQGSSYAFAGQAAGTYNIALTVGSPNFNPATADTSITVREYRPPTGTVQANPSQIYSEEMSTVTASFQGQCGGPIKAPDFTSTAGTMQGNQFDSKDVPFDQTDRAEQRKTVTITASASDNRNLGTATTTIEVIKKAAPIAAIRLPDVIFDANDSRVNNCGKRILLEQLRAYIQRDPTGSVVLVGHSSSDEAAASLDLQRAMNSAAVVTAGTGICLAIPKSQVLLSATGVDQNGVNFESSFCASSVNAGASTAASMRRVEVWFVPTGGQPPASLTKSQTATSLSVSELGCPK